MKPQFTDKQKDQLRNAAKWISENPQHFWMNAFIARKTAIDEVRLKGIKPDYFDEQRKPLCGTVLCFAGTIIYQHFLETGFMPGQFSSCAAFQTLGLDEDSFEFDELWNMFGWYEDEDESYNDEPVLTAENIVQVIDTYIEQGFDAAVELATQRSTELA